MQLVLCVIQLLLVPLEAVKCDYHVSTPFFHSMPYSAAISSALRFSARRKLARYRPVAASDLCPNRAWISLTVNPTFSIECAAAWRVACTLEVPRCCLHSAFMD